MDENQRFLGQKRKKRSEKWFNTFFGLSAPSAAWAVASMVPMPSSSAHLRPSFRSCALNFPRRDNPCMSGNNQDGMGLAVRGARARNDERSSE